MDTSFNSSQGAVQLIPRLNDEIETKFSSLLETKHLYQKVMIEGDQVISLLRAQVISAYHVEFNRMISDVPKMPFIPALSVGRVQSQGDLGQIPLVLLLRNVTMFCQQPQCDRKEAFRPIWHMDLTQQLRPLAPGQVRRLPLPTNFQVFLLAYQCQHCEGKPETLVVRRIGWQLSLEGRSPMASVEVASYIPKKENYLFRDAIIANGAGKTLAGLFYLRTFVEQFGRRMTGIAGKETGDQILSEYSKTLPANLRDSMPSLAEWYDKLSAAIHSANPDEELFKAAQEKIDKHFEIRKAMSIPETSAKELKAGAPEADDSPGN
jgi:hypothetical protein